MKVRIGSMDYTLTQKHPMYVVSDCGFCDWDEAIIAVNPDKGVQCKQQTFWHEAVHAMLNELGKTKLNDDEDFVDSLSKMIYALHKDNKLDKIYQFLQ